MIKAKYNKNRFLRHQKLKLSQPQLQQITFVNTNKRCYTKDTSDSNDEKKYSINKKQSKDNDFDKHLMTTKIEQQIAHIESDKSDNYDQDFESYSSIACFQQNIQEQGLQYQKMSSKNDFNNNSLIEDAPIKRDKLLNGLSCGQILKLNQELIIKIQQMRKMKQQILINSKIIEQQKSQLSKLRQKKQRAIDYVVEVQLSRERQKSLIKSHMAIAKIKKYEGEINLSRYININMCESPLTSSRSLTYIQSKYLSVKEQLLTQRRLQQINQRKINMLLKKIVTYKELNEKYESILCKGNLKRLSKRKELFQMQLDQMKMDFQIECIHQETQNNAIKLQTQSVMLKIIDLQRLIVLETNRSLENSREKRKQKKSKKKITKLKTEIQQTAVNSSQIYSKVKRSRAISDISKNSIKPLNNLDYGYFKLKTPKVIKKFVYDGVRARNYYNFTQSK